MKWINRIGLIGLLLGTILQAQAQNEMPATGQKTNYYSGFYLGSHASTNGWGFNAKYTVTDWLAFKTGYETLTFKTSFDFSEYDISYNAELDYKTGGILLLADFSYAKNLYISAGAVLNSFNPELKGYATSDLQYGDIVIKSEDIGDFTFSFKPGLKVSPYISAGYQAFLGKMNRFVFNFETGIYYMGPPDIEIEANGLLAPTADPAHEQKELLEYQFESYKIYPVVKFNLAVKLF
ncbi:MAG: hypothetical protein ABFS16_09155 [Bacteroidota bacterium]